jgi:NADH-quinone oxidoreductase subunit C
MVEANTTVADLRTQFGNELTESSFRDNHRVQAPPEKALAVLTWLKEQRGFDMLVDITAVDYLEYPEATDRFHVIYLLLNMTTKERLIVKAPVNLPDPALASVVPLWKGADWMEREVYDMFGIDFTGHPDLRRILMPEEFTAFPLRKDYPCKGFGERHNFPVLTRAES